MEQDNLLTPSFEIHWKDAFKYAALNAAIHRVTQIPLSPEAEDEEVLFIQKIVEVNGLTANVEQLICRQRLMILYQEHSL